MTRISEVQIVKRWKEEGFVVRVYETWKEDDGSTSEKLKEEFAPKDYVSALLCMAEVAYREAKQNVRDSMEELKRASATGKDRSGNGEANA